jgi:hypothetical protein
LGGDESGLPRIHVLKWANTLEFFISTSPAGLNEWRLFDGGALAWLGFYHFFMIKGQARRHRLLSRRAC